MKKFLLLLLLIVAMVVPAAAHSEGGKPDGKKLKELREYKLKYIAQEIDLTEQQRDKFIEIYDSKMNALKANFERQRSAEKKLKGDLSESECKKQMEIISDCKLNDVRIDKEYDAKFEKVLSAKQIYKMKEAEEKFRKKMMELHQKRKHERESKKSKR